MDNKDICILCLAAASILMEIQLAIYRRQLRKFCGLLDIQGEMNHVIMKSLNVLGEEIRKKS